MAEELSPESKLYVKEEIEKARKEIKEEIEKVKSKATKTFTTVVMVVGLLTGLGVYGIAKDYINTAVKDKLGEETLAEFEKNISKAEESVADANTYVEQAKGLVADVNDSYEEITKILAQANKDPNDLLISKLKSHQLAEPNGYAWIGDLKFVWGTRSSTHSKAQKFDFDPKKGVNNKSKYNFKECFTVITSLGGRIKKYPESFTLDRHDDYRNEEISLYYVAIGH
ncbi:MAG: hypothetical protein ACFFCW_42460 [Candidatus Hodarchaeota archaeon]